MKQKRGHTIKYSKVKRSNKPLAQISLPLVLTDIENKLRRATFASKFSREPLPAVGDSRARRGINVE
jgi:hypothetical protein